MILSFEEIQEKYISVYEEILTVNQVQQKLFEVLKHIDKSKVNELEDADLEALLNEIINGGYMILNLEGLLTNSSGYRVL